MPHLWKGLVILRVVWTLLPQTGYIHPDEFFQSVEVVAGDVFEIKVHRTWEFNSTSPIRSITFPYLISWIPFQLLRIISNVLQSTITAYQLLLLPRCIMCVFSIITDIMVQKIAKCCSLDGDLAVMLMASSYITLTYFTRTFSNSFECFMFVIFLYLVIKSHKNLLHSSLKIDRTYKSSRHSPPHNIKYINLHASLIAIVVVVGSFNRPTFVLFAAAPFLWLLSQVAIDLCSKKQYTYMVTLLSVLLSSSSMTFLLVCSTDSFYYNGIFPADLIHDVSLCLPPTFRSIQCMRQIFSNYFVVTPWNFIRYNSQSENLMEHGMHPHYLHVAVNMPLLFGPLIIYIFVEILRKMHLKSFKNEINQIVPFYIFLLFPVVFLSLFPHQEPRFLIPLLPITVLISTSHLKNGKWKNTVWIIWIMFNLILSLFFGVLHQGGLIPAISHLQRYLGDRNMHKNGETNHNSEVAHSFVIFHHTYMPPRHLLFNKYDFVHVIDLKGDDFARLKSSISEIKMGTNFSSRNIFYVTPAVFLQKVLNLDHINMTIHKKFCPHFSSEDPPDFAQFSEIKNTNFINAIPYFVSNLCEILSLYILEVH